MIGGRCGSRLTRASAGGLVVLLGAVAHVSAGGTVDLVGLAAVFLIASALSVCLAGRLRWTFGRLIPAVVVAQAVLHVVFAQRHQMAVSHDMAEHHHHGMTMAMPHGGASTLMLVAHAAVALLAVVAVQWGLRWLASMAGLPRALVLARRGAHAPITLIARHAISLADPHTPSPAALLTWDSRGPPS